MFCQATSFRLKKVHGCVFACRIAAQVELKLEQADSARGYLRECERLCTAIEQGWSPPTAEPGLGSFADMLEARAEGLRLFAEGYRYVQRLLPERQEDRTST